MTHENNNEHMPQSENPTIRMHMWLETHDGVFFGLGRAQLLDKIDKLGSLKKAAESMGMSYRGAWGKIKKTEKILGLKLIEKISNKEGYILTDDGRFLKNYYLEWLDDIEQYAHDRAQKLFPWDSESYQNKIPHRNTSKKNIPNE